MAMEKIMDSQKQGQNPPPETEELLLSLPRVKLWEDRYLCRYQGFWIPSWFLHGMTSFQKHFQAKHSDIILITFPKSGTTWLKALTFAIVNRSRYASLEQSPLLTTFPHDLVRFLEVDLYLKDQLPNLDDLPTPRILATHAPYASLPYSILNSNCRIVYMCRNPLDQLISEWSFLIKLQGETAEPRSIDEAFEMACDGIQCYGPIWEHILEYWKASLEDPHKILFLKYEDLKKDTIIHLKSLAEFLGCPFSKDEENQGVIGKISKLCSFDNLKILEVNNGKHPEGLEKSLFFRKGKVGDWKNYITPSMSKRMVQLLEEKLSQSGLTFESAF